MRFTAIRDFFSEETGSKYAAGLSYTIRAQDSKLAKLVPIWVEQGNVVWGAADADVINGKE